MIKQQFGYAKVRYRGLGKNTLRPTMLSALGNLWVARMRILELQGQVRLGCRVGTTRAEAGLKPVQSDPQNAGCTGNW